MLLLLLAGLAAARFLGLSLEGLAPRGGGLEVAREFLRAALRPALAYEAEFVPPGAPPFLLRLLEAISLTVAFAAAAMSLALPGGIALGFLGSTSWWEGEAGRPRALAPMVQVAARSAAAMLRSVHELLWAVLLLAALGAAPAAGVLALAIPYTGILGKVFAEMLDEAPRESADALRGAGAAPALVFVFGRLPRALPDMAAYAFFRFECAVRSAAVLGFFGLPTIGYHLEQGFENLHYREVWSHLYALVALVLVLEAWSGAVRRRFVA